MAKILLAGANGIIGSYIYKIFKKEQSIFPLSLTKNKNIYSLDLNKLDDVKNFVKSNKKFDVLIFLVGLAHKAKRQYKNKDFRNINKYTLINLITTLEKYNRLPNKIIFSSTISVYGELINKNIYNEDSKKKPHSSYAITKLEAENFLLENYRDKCWILRFSPVYSDKFKLNLNRRTKIKNLFYRVGDGENKISLCNIKNIQTVIQAILEDRIQPNIYNISDKKEYTFNDILVKLDAKYIFPIPQILIKGIYLYSKLVDNKFLEESSIKLCSNNVFPSDKIRKQIPLPFNLEDIKLL